MGYGKGRGFGFGCGIGLGSGHGQGLGKGTFSSYSCVKFVFFAFNVIFWVSKSCHFLSLPTDSYIVVGVIS